MTVQVFVNNDIIRTRCQGTISGERFENVLHFRFKEATVTTTYMGDFIRNYFLNQLRAILSSSVEYYAVGMARVSPSPVGEEDTQTIVPIAGAGVGDRLPNQCAYLMKIQTDHPEHPYRRGRTYLPGVLRSHWVNEGWSQTAVSQFQSIGQLLINDFSVVGASPFEWGVQSRGDHDTSFLGMRSVGWSSYPCIIRSRRPRVF